MKPTRAAVYTRISTREGRQHRENQTQAALKYCCNQNYQITEEYSDETTGAKSRRPALDRLMNDARHRRFDVVVVWSLDRFTRAGIGEAFAALQHLDQCRVSFESIQEPYFRTGGPTGQLLIAVAAWIAEQERARIGERVTAGLRRARAAGKVLGRPAVPTVTRHLRILQEQGKSIRVIARETGLSRATVARRLAAQENSP